MNIENFIKEQVQNLKNDISENDVIRNVKNYAAEKENEFGKHGGFINFCMQLYAEIYLETYRE